VFRTVKLIETWEMCGRRITVWVHYMFSSTGKGEVQVWTVLIIVSLNTGCIAVVCV
jgi:hypothetical protein